jgi:hypothetical protein
MIKYFWVFDTFITTQALPFMEGQLILFGILRTTQKFKKSLFHANILLSWC